MTNNRDPRERREQSTGRLMLVPSNTISDFEPEAKLKVLSSASTGGPDPCSESIAGKVTLPSRRVTELQNGPALRCVVSIGAASPRGHLDMVRVVLADDNPHFCDVIRSMLGGPFAVVAAVGDGRQLLTAILDLDPDLVITDLSMPYLDGPQLARELKKASCRTKIIMLTMHNDQALISAALDAGILGYVLKARLSHDLLPAVDKVLNGSGRGCRRLIRQLSVCEADNRNLRSGVGPGHRNLSLGHGYQRSVVMVLTKRLREGVVQGKITLQRQNMDEPPSQRREALSNGRGRNRDLFGQPDRVCRYHSRVGARVRFSGCARSSQSGETWSRRQRLSDSFPLHTSTHAKDRPGKESAKGFLMPLSRWIGCAWWAGQIRRCNITGILALARFPRPALPWCFYHHGALAAQDEKVWCMALTRSRLP
jgi:DNA-binding NarL/FixJ family response regulator